MDGTEERGRLLRVLVPVIGGGSERLPRLRDTWRADDGDQVSEDVGHAATRDAEVRSQVAVVFERRVLQSILRHLRTTGQQTSVHARDPPAA